MRLLIKKLVNTNLSKLSNEELFELYDFYSMKLGRLFNCYIVTQPHRIVKIEKELQNFLERKKIRDLTHYFSILVKPDKKIVFLKEGNKFFNSSFSELLKGETDKIDKFLAYKKMYYEKRKENIEKEKIMRELKLGKKVKIIIRILSELGYERFKMRFFWMPAIYFNELFLMEFKRRYGVKKAELRAYDELGIENLIKTGQRIGRKEINERKKGFLKILKEGKILTYTGNNAERILAKLIKKNEKSNKVEGMVASKGYVVGKAIVFSYKKSGEHSKKMNGMKKGEIVITEMTRPNIIPACEKAAAIVTDEGGVLSHAAIVSRELGIPCVIGTKKSTEIFKDGDLLEVNANKGVVRKISNEEYNKLKVLLVPEEKVKNKNASEEKYKKLKKEEVIWFDNLDKGDVPSVGGKGANLGELSKFVKVPEGFCISVKAYSKFIEENGIKKKISKIIKNAKADNLESFNEVSYKIKKIILSKNISKNLANEIIKNYNRVKNKKVAVRSSATAEDLPGASFAGQQDTYLNVIGKKEILDSVKKCWASLFTPRAIYYREKNKFQHEKVLISVVIQEMINPEYAGVIFTLDPINKKDIMIEAVKGLGEKLVSGEITPNNYIISKNKLKVLNKKENFSISIKTILGLAGIAKIIEEHYKKPQDIEWAIDKKGCIFILQSRPITA
jgi:phosphoenolpyruvate synthase/pyruvate phosphate dikinase